MKAVSTTVKQAGLKEKTFSPAMVKPGSVLNTRIKNNSLLFYMGDLPELP